MPDLHARLLAEIERRESNWRQPEPTNGDELGYTAREVLAYLAALRKLVEMHRRDDLGCECCRNCAVCDSWEWPCRTVAAAAEALGVEG